MLINTIHIISNQQHNWVFLILKNYVLMCHNCLIEVKNHLPSPVEVHMHLWECNRVCISTHTRADEAGSIALMKSAKGCCEPSKDNVQVPGHDLLTGHLLKMFHWGAGPAFAF